MQLSLVPMLHEQRALYGLPRGLERFHRYIEVMTGGTDDVLLPLMSFNPMGKPHAAAALDALLALGAEEVAADAVAEAERRLPAAGQQLRVGLVLADDAMGGWTQRHLSEAQQRFEQCVDLKRGWLVVLLWTSERATRESLREDVLSSVYRALYFARHGPPKTLRQMLRQEGLAGLFASARQPALEPEELAYTREVLRPHLDSTHFPTVFAYLYGDEAARAVGYAPLGVSARAGFAVALADARERGEDPAQALSKQP